MTRYPAMRERRTNCAMNALCLQSCNDQKHVFIHVTRPKREILFKKSQSLTLNVSCKWCFFYILLSYVTVQKAQHMKGKLVKDMRGCKTVKIFIAMTSIIIIIKLKTMDILETAYSFHSHGTSLHWAIYVAQPEPQISEAIDLKCLLQGFFTYNCTDMLRTIISWRTKHF